VREQPGGLKGKKGRRGLKGVLVSDSHRDGLREGRTNEPFGVLKPLKPFNQ